MVLASWKKVVKDVCACNWLVQITNESAMHREVKKLIQMFYRQAVSYDDGYMEGDSVLAESVWA